MNCIRPDFARYVESGLDWSGSWSLLRRFWGTGDPLQAEDLHAAYTFSTF